MDKLAQKTKKAKVLSVKMHYTTKRLDDLESEKTVFRSYILEINQYLQRLLETHDSMLTILVQQHLSEKRKLVLALLNQLEGVLGSDALPKKGENWLIKKRFRRNNLNQKRCQKIIKIKNRRLTRRVM